MGWMGCLKRLAGVRIRHSLFINRQCSLSPVVVRPTLLVSAVVLRDFFSFNIAADEPFDDLMLEFAD